MQEFLKQNFQKYKHWRHDFHQYPELSYKENLTASKVAEILRSFKLDSVTEKVGGLGVVGVLKNGEGPSIALRADMDALPIKEESPHAYTSAHEGVMHACGHDGHIVMLLAACEYLSKHKPFKGSVVFIFQPAEEAIDGAPMMLKDGLLERFPFESIYTLHSWPGAAPDALFVDEGYVMASVNNFEIAISASGGHAARPQLSADPIVAGCEMVSALQTLVSRKADPMDALVISVTYFQSGFTNNIIPNRAIIRGTARFVTKSIAKWLPDKMRSVVEGVARAHEVSAELSLVNLCPATFNTATESALAGQVIESLYGKRKPGKEQALSMGSDDFCFYLDEVPGAYVYIGNGVDSKGLHHCEYDFNDEAIIHGASFYIKLVEQNAKQA